MSAAAESRPFLLSFFVPYLPPMNTSATRRHWSHAHREVKRWRTIVSTQRPKPHAPLKHARVTMVRLSAVEPDYENLAQSFKAALDALVWCGFLIDDGPKHVERVYRWGKVRPRRGVVGIQIEELE